MAKRKEKIPKINRKEVLARRKEMAIAKAMEQKKIDRKWFNLLRNTKKLSAYELGVFREACEEYDTAIKAFYAGKIVRGKGEKQTVTIVPHPPEPSFDKIYKKHAKAAGLYRKTASV